MVTCCCTAVHWHSMLCSAADCYFLHLTCFTLLQCDRVPSQTQVLFEQIQGLPQTLDTMTYSFSLSVTSKELNKNITCIFLKHKTSRELLTGSSLKVHGFSCQAQHLQSQYRHSPCRNTQTHSFSWGTVFLPQNEQHTFSASFAFLTRTDAPSMCGHPEHA